MLAGLATLKESIVAQSFVIKSWHAASITVLTCVISGIANLASGLVSSQSIAPVTSRNLTPRLSVGSHCLHAVAPVCRNSLAVMTAG